ATKTEKFLCASHPKNCSILLQHLLFQGFGEVYAKPRCSAFIASLSAGVPALQRFSVQESGTPMQQRVPQSYVVCATLQLLMLKRAIVICSLAAVASAQSMPGLEPGTLPASWLTGGPNCLVLPDWQVHQYNSGFFIIRESGCINYEKPFLYLI